MQDPARGLIRTDLAGENSSRNKVARQLSPRGLRTADRLAGRVGANVPTGNRRPYLCHTLCELGAEPLEDQLRLFRSFLTRSRREVVVLFVEPYVPVETLERALDQAGLLGEVAALRRDEALPTLATLIRAKTRVVIFTEKDGGARPWYLPGFSFVQDTPLGARNGAQLVCGRNRGSADSPLLLLNHWIDGFPPSPSRNQRVGGGPPGTPGRSLRARTPATAEPRRRRLLRTYPRFQGHTTPQRPAVVRRVGDQADVDRDVRRVDAERGEREGDRGRPRGLDRCCFQAWLSRKSWGVGRRLARGEGFDRRRRVPARGRIARDELRRLRELTLAIAARETEIAGLVADVAPQLLSEPGVAPLTAAKLGGEIAGATASQATPSLPALPGWRRSRSARARPPATASMAAATVRSTPCPMPRRWPRPGGEPCEPPRQTASVVAGTGAHRSPPRRG